MAEITQEVEYLIYFYIRGNSVNIGPFFQEEKHVNA